MATVEDKSFANLLSELESKCGLSRQKIFELIQQKRTIVGDGYLTEQGALFLVAADLGAILEYGHEGPVSLARLSKNDSAVSVICRILSFGSLKSFTRKSDAARGALLRAVLYDNSSTLVANFWDKAAILLAQSDEFRPGTLVKISNVYLREGLNGSLVINVGENGIVDPCGEVSSCQVKTLTDLARSISSVPENGSGLVVTGIVVGDVRKAGFTRNGAPSEYTSFYLCDSEDRNLKRRVVLWGFSNPAISSIRDSDTVTLVNVRAKLATFQNTISPELHGDDTTVILELWSQTKDLLKQSAKSLEDLNKPVPTAGGNAQTVLPFVARIVSIRRSDDKMFALMVDSSGRKIPATITTDAVKKGANLAIDTLLVCKPESLDIECGKATFTKDGSLIESQSNRKDIPASKSLVSSIENLGQSGIVSLDVMCLTDHIEREIQTKDGLVRRSEMTIADHTGEIKIYGWRALSKLLEGYSAGDKIMISAAEVQTHEGKKFIVLRNYSSISRNAE